MNSRNTDLEQVKLVAHALLEVEIQPTEFSPMIVSHPFTNTGVVFFPDEQGNFTQADLFNHPTDLDRWRKRVGEQIDKAVDQVRQRYGYMSIRRALLDVDPQLGHINVRDGHVVHPVGFFGG